MNSEENVKSILADAIKAVGGDPAWGLVGLSANQYERILAILDREVRVSVPKDMKEIFKMIDKVEDLWVEKLLWAFAQ